ncbi:MAG: AIM24 family protein, partial [Leptolyngbyaceae cyanobacterium SM2_5_2]|nr:AIM24 family protein [Leptolyngbyaceae cyanobacterium SM2_5_2]
MQIELMYEHAYTLGRILLTDGEQVRVEAASMMGMSAGVTLETTATGGLYEIPA